MGSNANGGFSRRDHVSASSEGASLALGLISQPSCVMALSCARPCSPRCMAIRVS